MAKKVQIGEKLTEYLPLATVFMVAAGLLTYNLGHWSFWFDESFTSALIKFEYGEIAERTANDVHPPLYYYLLKFWAGIFGTGDAALRAFSSVLMLGAAFSLYGLIKKMANKWVGLLAMVFVTAGPFFIRYGQEARMYALAAMIISLATIILHTQINRPKKNRSVGLWILYGVLIAASLYTHYFTFPVIFAHWLYVVMMDTKLTVNRKLTLKKTWKALKGLDRGWWKANIMAALLFLPWLPTFYEQATRVNSGFWIQGIRHTTVTDTLAQVFAYDSFPETQGPARIWIGLLLTAWMILGIALLWRKINRSEKANLTLLAGPTVLSMAILILYSIPPFTSSIYSVRYLASFSVLLYASMAYIAWLIWKYASKHLAGFAALSLLAIMIGGSAQVVWGWGRDHFTANEGLAILNQVLEEGDAIVTQGYWQQYDAQHYIDSEYTVQTRVEGNFYGGETLLIGNDDVIIENYETDVTTETGDIWYISNAEDDFSQLPDSWVPTQELYFERDFKITRMVVVR